MLLLEVWSFHKRLLLLLFLLFKKTGSLYHFVSVLTYIYYLTNLGVSPIWVVSTSGSHQSLVSIISGQWFACQSCVIFKTCLLWEGSNTHRSGEVSRISVLMLSTHFSAHGQSCFIYTIIPFFFLPYYYNVNLSYYTFRCKFYVMNTEFFKLTTIQFLYLKKI